MPLRWHVNLPGPVAYSRPIRKNRGRSGPLTSLLVWFIVKPLELIFKGVAKLFTVRSRSNTEQPVAQSAIPSTSFWPRPGWYWTQYGYLWFNGVAWVRPDGRPF